MSASVECSISQFAAGSTPQLCVLATAFLALLSGKPCNVCKRVIATLSPHQRAYRETRSMCVCSVS